VREIFEEFLSDLDISKGRSLRTCQIYRQILRTFDKFLAGKNYDEEQARAYIRSRAKEVSPTTQSLEVAALRHLSRWLEQKETNSKAWNLKAPRAAKKIIRIFSDADLVLLLKVVAKASLSEQILFYLLYGSGLRISEALQLDWQKINLENKSAHILGKGSKWRMVPLTTETVLLMTKVKDRRVSGSWHDEIITYPMAHKWIAVWGEKSGINAKYGVLHPHRLRHAIASHLLRRGAKLPHIQKLLGHKQLSTTQKYTHLEVEDLLKAYDRAIPKKLVA